MREADLRVDLGYTLRTYEDQDRLYEQGRTQPGPIVTNARGGESFHNFRVAYDIRLFDGSGRYIVNGADAAYQRAGLLGEGLKLEWGGRWISPVDPSHFQLTRGVDVGVMRARYEAGLDVFTGR
jgi:peptidoglycan L-alanyl-D-glutamate endopeptidase CwlK